MTEFEKKSIQEEIHKIKSKIDAEAAEICAICSPFDYTDSELAARIENDEDIKNLQQELADLESAVANP